MDNNSFLLHDDFPTIYGLVYICNTAEEIELLQDNLKYFKALLCRQTTGSYQCTKNIYSKYAWSNYCDVFTTELSRIRVIFHKAKFFDWTKFFAQCSFQFWEFIVGTADFLSDHTVEKKIKRKISFDRRMVKLNRFYT